MRLRNHIAYRFITDKNFCYDLAFNSLKLDSRYTELTKEQVRNAPENTDEVSALNIEKALFSIRNNRNVLITDTVMDLLDLLKVRRTVDENRNFDWSVFAHITDRKRTFILPDDKMIRMRISEGYMHFVFIQRTEKDIDGDKGKDYITFTRFWINNNDNAHKMFSRNINHGDVKQFDEFIYKIMCFIYLSENDLIILAPGEKRGTKRSGKIINELGVPLMIINSKWNITTIRTEGFNVSGHWRLQRYGEGRKRARFILIDPFRKHGYIRHAANESTNETSPNTKKQ